MIAFDVKKMSEDEWAFIRLYCAAVQYDYDLLQIVSALLAPNFNIRKVNEAVRLARQLQNQQAQVVAKLYDIGEKYGHKKPTKDVPPTELIADVFTKSFFKILDSATKSVIVLDKKDTQHDGWSSGNPAYWQNAIYDMQEIHAQIVKTKNMGESPFMSAFFNLFSFLPKNFSLNDWHYPEYDELEDWDDEHDYFDDDDTPEQYSS